MNIFKLQSGTLRSAMLRQTNQALHYGILQQIKTTETWIEDRGVHFIVRQMSGLVTLKKQQAYQSQAAPNHLFNPFLPYDPNLYVADISNTHVVLLNKYNVINHHLLIVTRAFERQEALLNLADFTALAACITELNGLGFYNSGTVAGASQPHKHLQIVPFALDSAGTIMPIEPLIENAPTQCGRAAITIPNLPFRHALSRFNLPLNNHSIAARILLDSYYTLLDASGLQCTEERKAPQFALPYNLLITQQWMLLIPRSTECVEGISVNALGFAGALFVHDATQTQIAKKLGPMSILEQVALPIAQET